MKRIITIILCFSLCLGICACGSGENTETTDTTPTQSEEEAKVEKILIIGNSHSGDTFWLLQQVFDAHYDKDVVLGYLYYSGCTISEHLQFAKNGEAVYAYRRNYTGKENGTWDDMKDVTMDVALVDQQWDVIVYQAGSADYRQSNFNENERRQLEEYVDQFVPQPHISMWNNTWTQAGAGPVFESSWPVKAPSGYVDRVNKGFDPATDFSSKLELVKNHIATDEHYEKVLTPGTAVMYALLEMERPQTDLYRDYTHLTEFGRLIAAYAFFTQYTGQMVDEIKIDVVPARLRSSRYVNEGDLEVTQEMKDVILKAAGYAFAHPFEMPPEK